MHFLRELMLSFVLGYLHLHIPEASNLLYWLRRKRKVMGDLMRTLGIPNRDKEQSRRLKLWEPCCIYPVLSPSFVSFKICTLKIIIRINMNEFLNMSLDRKLNGPWCSEGQQSWQCVPAVTPSYSSQDWAVVLWVSILA